MRSFASNISYSRIPTIEESIVEESKCCSSLKRGNDDLVVVGSFRDNNCKIICVENGDGLFPSLPNDNHDDEKEETTGLWEYIFGKEKKREKKYALYLRDANGECTGLESRRTRVRLPCLKEYEVIQVFNDGMKRVILPKNFELQRCPPDDILSISQSNRKYPIYESAIRFGNVIMSELGDKVGVSDMKKFIERLYTGKLVEQQAAFIEKLYEIDQNQCSIHPLYYIFAFTEIGKSLRYFKLLKKLSKIYSPNLENMLATNSMIILCSNSLCLVDHYKQWVRIPKEKMNSYYWRKDLQFEYLKTRLTQPKKEQCLFQFTEKINNDSSFNNARKDIIEKSSVKVKEKAYFQSQHLSCRLVEEENIQCKDIFPIYWQADTFKVESEVDLMVLSGEVLNIASKIEQSFETNNEFVKSHIDWDFVDMRYFYKIELKLERGKQLCSSMLRIKETEDIVQTLSNQIKVVEMLMVAIFQIAEYEELSIQFNNRFTVIMMLSEWIDHCLNFIQDIVKHFIEEGFIDQPFIDEIILERIIKNEDLGWNELFEMTKFLSAYSSSCLAPAENHIISAGKLINAYSKWIQKSKE